MHLTLHLTTACNLRCGYCYSPPRPGPFMTEDTASLALELAAATSKQAAGIVLFGGEPLLCPDLLGAIVRRARALTRAGAVPFHFKLTTNGMLLDERMVAFAVEHDVAVAVSCDGVRVAHDRHRLLPDGTGSYERVRAGLELLLRCKPYSHVAMVVSPDTAAWLTESVSELLNLGCRYLIVSLDHTGPWTEESLGALGAEYERLADRYVAWMRAGRKFYLSPFEVKLASRVDGERYCADRCELGTRQISVDPEGYLYPCVQFTRAGPGSAWCIGHVRTGLDARAVAAIRAAARDEQEPCRGCAIRHRCNHTCGCLNWQTTGSAGQVSPVLCRSEQLLVPIADRIGALLYGEREPNFLHKHYNPAWPILSLVEDARARELE